MSGQEDASKHYKNLRRDQACTHIAIVIQSWRVCGI